MTQNHLRRTYQCIRSNLPLSYQQQCAQKITESIVESSFFKQAQHIAFYWSIRGEVDLHAVWKTALQCHKHCYFPVLNCNTNMLSFFSVNQHTVFEKNRFGIPEPSYQNTAINPEDLDLVLLPLVSFDIYGTRMGMGKGYYDRTFQNISHPTLVGVAYEFQKQARLEKHPWDVPLHVMITDHHIYRSKAS